MEEKHVRDIMIPIKDYAVVSQDMTIKEAMQVMKERSLKVFPENIRYLAALVKDSRGRIVGKITQADILRGLEPSYNVGGAFLSPSLREKLADVMAFIPDRTFSRRCKVQNKKKVRDFMTTVALSVEVNDTLSHALHILLISDHRELLVTTQEKEALGMLRLSDIYQVVEEAILEE